MASSAKKTSKPTFKTARPHTEVHWPKLTSAQRTNIMHLLCNLLQPLGDYRKTHMQPSKGKKRKRQSRKDDRKDVENDGAHPQNSAMADTPPPPPPPEIGNHILIGLNSVTRRLEASAAQTAPATMPAHQSADRKAKVQDESSKGNIPGELSLEHTLKDAASSHKLRPLSLVLINHDYPPSSLPHAHIPTLVHLCTLNSPEEEVTRLLAVPPGCELDIAAALQIPHVSAIGILEGAPGAESLMAYVRANVDLTRCDWIDEAMKPEWKGVKIDTQQV